MSRIGFRIASSNCVIFKAYRINQSWRFWRWKLQMCPIMMTAFLSNCSMLSAFLWEYLLEIAWLILKYLSLNAICSTSPAKMSLIRDAAPLACSSASFIMSETVQILMFLFCFILFCFNKSQLTSWITQTFALVTWKQVGTFWINKRLLQYSTSGHSCTSAACRSFF